MEKSVSKFKSMQSGAVIALCAGIFVFVLHACATLGTLKGSFAKVAEGAKGPEGIDTYDVRSLYLHSFKHGAFEICRSRHKSGYRILEGPYGSGEGKSEVRGKIRCVGALDPELEAQYSSAKFNARFAPSQADPGRETFEIDPK
ncbi:MAG: hypothetical protein AB7P04_01060 [Bacteriovoracia bacterium]